MKCASAGTFRSSTPTKVRASQLNVAFVGRNLLTWTDFPNYDPENSTNAGNGGQGYDMGAMPTTRSVRHQPHDRSVTDTRENSQMKRTRLSVALAVAALSATACQTDLTGLNTNPNSPTTAPAAALFTNAVDRRGRPLGRRRPALRHRALRAAPRAGAVRRGGPRPSSHGNDRRLVHQRLRQRARGLRQGRAAAARPASSPNTSGPALRHAVVGVPEHDGLLGRHPVQRSAQGRRRRSAQAEVRRAEGHLLRPAEDARPTRRRR